MRRLLRNPLVWAVAGVLLVGAVFGMIWFTPWKLFTNNEVNEALPEIAAPAGAPPAQPGAAPQPPKAANLLLASGSFITHEHETSGEVQVVELADGRRQLVLRKLTTSDGPDLRVWLTDQPVREGTAGWRVFDDGKWVELGKLKGNRGNQVYDIPKSVDLAKFRSVTIWCKRFSVSFGAAELHEL
jgi:hypothetical protein